MAPNIFAEKADLVCRILRSFQEDTTIPPFQNEVCWFSQSNGNSNQLPQTFNPIIQRPVPVFRQPILFSEVPLEPFQQQHLGDSMHTSSASTSNSSLTQQTAMFSHGFPYMQQANDVQQVNVSNRSFPEQLFQTNCDNSHQLPPNRQSPINNTQQTNAYTRYPNDGAFKSQSCSPAQHLASLQFSSTNDIQYLTNIPPPTLYSNQLESHTIISSLPTHDQYSQMKDLNEPVSRPQGQVPVNMFAFPPPMLPNTSNNQTTPNNSLKPFNSIYPVSTNSSSNQLDTVPIVLNNRSMKVTQTPLNQICPTYVMQRNKITQKESTPVIIRNRSVHQNQKQPENSPATVQQFSTPPPMLFTSPPPKGAKSILNTSSIQDLNKNELKVSFNRKVFEINRSRFKTDSEDEYLCSRIIPRYSKANKVSRNGNKQVNKGQDKKPRNKTCSKSCNYNC